MDEERDIQNDTASKLSKLADTQLGSSMAAGAVAAIVSRICTRTLLLQSTATLPVKIARMNLYHEPHVPCISYCQMRVSCHHILLVHSSNKEHTSVLQIQRTQLKQDCRCKAHSTQRPCTTTPGMRSQAWHGRRDSLVSTGASEQSCWALHPPRCSANARISHHVSGAHAAARTHDGCP